MSVNYNQLADEYNKYRKPDPHIAGKICKHIRVSMRVLNVGAGLGSYEPSNCYVVAIDRSRELIATRKMSSIGCFQGYAEELPFEDDEFDV